MNREGIIKYLPSRWSTWLLSVFVLIAVFGNVLVTEKELFIGPVVSYSANTLDHKNANYVSPFDDQVLGQGQSRHWLGTDSIGRDTLAGLINGAWIAFWVGVLTLMLSLVIGLPIGLITGFYGNSFKVGLVDLILNLFLGLVLFYYLIYYGKSWIHWFGLVLTFGFVKLGIIEFFNKFLPARKTWTFPIDDVFTKVVEVFRSIPVLVILILLLGLFSHSGVFRISVLLGIFYWITIARYVRAEVLALKESDLIDAQRSLGTSDFRILWKHCLPKALPPVLVSMIFLFGSTILMEATLSFFGLGLPLDQVSWGTMLNESRKYLGAWWLGLFPGLSLFGVLAALANEAYYWSYKLNPQLKD